MTIKQKSDACLVHVVSEVDIKGKSVHIIEGVGASKQAKVSALLFLEELVCV